MTLHTQKAPSQNPPALTLAQRRRERERVATREKILLAALDVARRDGWDAVTMRRLAEEIEYSTNFAYRYFTGRDDILLTLVREGFLQLREAIVTASQRTEPDPGGLNSTSGVASTGPSSAAALRRAGHAYIDFALANPDLYQLMYSLGGTRVPATHAWTEGQAVGDIMTELLTATGDPQPEHHVLQLWATAHGLIALLTVGRVGIDTNELHTVFDSALTDCLNHVLPEPKQPTSELAEGTLPPL